MAKRLYDALKDCKKDEVKASFWPCLNLVADIQSALAGGGEPGVFALPKRFGW